MADVKISALPAASSILNTDVAPVVTGGVTKKASATVITTAALAASTAGSNPALIGPATSANATRFPNALSVVSNTAAGIQKNESHNIGIMAEGTANAADTNIYGVGVYGVGYTASGTRCGGVIGEGHVSATGDTGSAIGVRGYANDTHAGGLNIGLYGNASGGSSNYALYMAGGDIYTTTTQTWTLGGGGNLIISGGGFRVTGAGTAGSTDAFQVSGSAPASAVVVSAAGNLNALTITEASSPVVVQTDIGTGENEIPLNQYLGSLAYVDTAMVSVPASASAAGVMGQIAQDGSYLYVCTAANTWKRVAIATW